MKIYKDNKEKVTAYKREWDKNKLETDPIYKIKKDYQRDLD